ncbi:hypothetical protein DE146DRAFT_8446 [Phaeosphaeria sp. MPI-PUGE-AT-0046c]|nr:hypothetical protein DE146DRAFT_8446 [Phaeosphaeria sp. MPI-PUGE-AT-0046c]
MICMRQFLLERTVPNLDRTSCHSSPSQMSFLSLPRELRNIIYAHIWIPFALLSDFSGLYLSCKQIKAECDLENQLSLHAYIRDLQTRAQGVRISLPEHNIIGSPRLHVSLATSIFTDYPTGPRELHLPLAASIIDEILSKPFASVVITYHEDNDVRFGTDNIRWIHQHLILGLALSAHKAHARRVVIEPPSLTGSWLGRWINLSVGAGLRHRDWTVGCVGSAWSKNDERRTGMVWERSNIGRNSV